MSWVRRIGWVGLCLGVSVSFWSLEAASKKNVLLILADDQGFCELGAYSDFADPATMGAKRIDE